jgi:hypothetical protein
MPEERTATEAVNREPEHDSANATRLNWLAKAAGAVSFQRGIYLRIKDDPTSTLQSLLTTFGTVAVMSLLGTLILSSDYGGAFPPLVWFGWTILLFPWTGVVYALAGGIRRSVHYVELLNGVGFSMLGMIVPEGLRTMAYAMFGDAGSLPIAGPLLVLSVVWVLGMQIHAAREIVGSSWMRSVTAVVAPPATVVAAGFLFVGALLGAFGPPDDTYLPALLDDPVADLNLPGIELERSYENEQSGRGLWGGSHAAVTRTYRVVEDGRGPEIFETAVREARAAGWVFHPAGSVAGPGETLGNAAYKMLEPGPAVLSLSLDEGGDLLSLRLDYGLEAPWIRDGTGMTIGSTVTITDMNEGQNEYLTFDGAAGDVVTLHVSPSLQPADIDVLVATPDGGTLWSTLDDENAADAPDIRFGPTRLEETGTYIVVLDPADGKRGAVRLDLQYTGEDAPTSAEVTMQIDSRVHLEPAPDQIMQVRFETQQGRSVSVYVESSYPPDQISAKAQGPEGESAWGHLAFAELPDVGSSLYMDAIEMPHDGAYTITFQPESRASGWITIEVFDATTQVPDPFGGFGIPWQAGDVFYTPGKNLYWVMEGRPGARVVMEFTTEGLLTADTSTPGLHVEVSAPSGELIWEGEVPEGYGRSDPFTLHEPGQYLIFLDPIGPTVGRFDVKVDLCGVEIPSC